MIMERLLPVTFYCYSLISCWNGLEEVRNHKTLRYLRNLCFVKRNVFWDKLNSKSSLHSFVDMNFSGCVQLINSSIKLDFSLYSFLLATRNQSLKTGEVEVRKRHWRKRKRKRRKRRKRRSRKRRRRKRYRKRGRRKKRKIRRKIRRREKEGRTRRKRSSSDTTCHPQGCNGCSYLIVYFSDFLSPLSNMRAL